MEAMEALAVGYLAVKAAEATATEDRGRSRAAGVEVEKAGVAGTSDDQKVPQEERMAEEIGAVVVKAAARGAWEVAD